MLAQAIALSAPPCLRSSEPPDFRHNLYALDWRMQKLASGCCRHERLSVTDALAGTLDSQRAHMEAAALKPGSKLDTVECIIFHGCVCTMALSV